VGRSAQLARRYRDLVVRVAEPVFDRALMIGSDVRHVARGGGAQADTAIAAAIMELRGLLARCEAAITSVRASIPYREAITSFTAGETERIASLACSIFTDVSPFTPTGVLYRTVPISSGRSGVHFLPPADCAARIQLIASEGLTATVSPAALGGDETITPVLLSDEHDGSESPIALAFEPHALPAPVCRLEASNVILFYADRLRAAFTIRSAARVNDEWWSVRPHSYREYLEELREILAAQSLMVVIDP